MQTRIMSKNGGTVVVDLNRRKAIHERCLNCVGWYSHEVNACEATDCPLHAFRTGRGSYSAKARKQAIILYCKWCTIDQINACLSTPCPLFLFRKGRLAKAKNCQSIAEKAHIEAKIKATEEHMDKLPHRILKRRKPGSTS